MPPALLRRACGALLFIGLMTGGGCGGDGNSPSDSDNPLPLERFDAGFFSINRPRGWDIVTAGSCTEFAFLMQDPAESRRQIFYFGSVGPIYLSQAQKDVDRAYMQAGGFNIPWSDAPVVDPLTPANYLAHWPAIAAMQAAGQFMPRFPHLTDIEVVAVRPQSALVPGATSAILRGLFSDNGQVAEGMFLVSVFVFSPYSGLPAGGTGYGYFICGATAPKSDFAGLVDREIESLNSFNVTESYISNCLALSQKKWGAVAAAGRTLSEASDIIFDGWASRSHSEDITAEKWTDSYRGVERVYDPDTGQVYECPLGWYDDYDIHRGQYDMSGLQRLPDSDWDLWMAAVLSGQNHIH